MHKKLEADLISLAHRILKMKNKDDVFALKEMSKEVYEKISILAFVEEYVNTTPNLEVSKEELVEKMEKAIEVKESIAMNTADKKQEVEKEAEEKVVYKLIEERKKEEKQEVEEKAPEIQAKEELPKVEEAVEKIATEIEQPFDELEELMFSKTEPELDFMSDVVRVEQNKTLSLEEELQDTFSVDVMADLFQNVQPKSLNDQFSKNIQIGLNDRIAFVKNLFDGEQEDYNRVISQLNTFKTAKEAKRFINKMVKPDYNWSEQEELESRFIEIIERKFA